VAYYEVTSIVPLDGTVRYASRILPTSVRPETDLPSAFQLLQNYPNPFNPTTTIVYSVGSREFVELKVYNVLGEEMATLVQGVQNPGTYSVRWDASGYAGGVYFYTLNAGNQLQVQKLVLAK
jgi:hypothetical protein